METLSIPKRVSGSEAQQLVAYHRQGKLASRTIHVPRAGLGDSIPSLKAVPLAARLLVHLSILTQSNPGRAGIYHFQPRWKYLNSPDPVNCSCLFRPNCPRSSKAASQTKRTCNQPNHINQAAMKSPQSRAQPARDTIRLGPYSSARCPLVRLPAPAARTTIAVLLLGPKCEWNQQSHSWHNCTDQGRSFALS